MRIDAHQHFWKFDPVRDTWIDDAMQVLRQDFLPHQLEPHLRKFNFQGCVAVQADQSPVENDFLLKLAQQNSLLLGVVGWVDLLAADLEEQLERLARVPKFKGVRHIAQAEPNDWFTRPDVQAGISKLSAYNLTFDLLIQQHQLPAAIKLAALFPNQAFVLDHIAKPQISLGLKSTWRENIRTLANYQNVYCKLSGLVTETTDWRWSKSEFTTFMELTLEAFGADRVMYGSDWPVCLLAATYEQQLGLVEDFVHQLSASERRQIMGQTACSFYQLTPSDKDGPQIKK